MASVTLRSLSLTTHRALKARAAASGRTVEAEVIEIVEMAVRGKAGVGLRGFDFGEVVRRYSVIEPEPPKSSTGS